FLGTLDGELADDPWNAWEWNLAIDYTGAAGTRAQMKAAMDRAGRILPDSDDIPLAGVSQLVEHCNIKQALELTRDTDRRLKGTTKPIEKLLDLYVSGDHLGEAARLLATLKQRQPDPIDVAVAACKVAVGMVGRGAVGAGG